MATSFGPLLFNLLPTLSIEDLATRSGLSVRTIRNYRDKELIDRPRRSGRKMLYAPSHIKQLVDIKQGLEQGLSLAEIAVGIHRHHKARGSAPRSTATEKERLIRMIPVVPGICVHVDTVLDAPQRKALKILRKAIREAQARHDVAPPTNKRVKQKSKP